MEAIILAGGQGTRMQKIEHKIPKVMLEINDRPFLYWIIKQLQANKVNKIILCLGIKHEQITKSFDKYNFENIEISYFIEDQQLGTGGALIKVLNLIKNNNFIFMNGDSIFNIPIQKLFKEHTKNQNDLTYSIKKLQLQNTEYGGISIKKNGEIVSHKMGADSKNKLIDAGLRVISKKAIDKIIKQSQNKYPISFENDIAPELIKNHKVRGLVYDFDFFDIGNPESYKYTKTNFAKIKNQVYCYE